MPSGCAFSYSVRTATTAAPLSEYGAVEATRWKYFSIGAAVGAPAATRSVVKPGLFETTVTSLAPLAASTDTTDAVCLGPEVRRIALTPLLSSEPTCVVRSVSVGLIWTSTRLKPTFDAAYFDPVTPLS